MVEEYDHHKDTTQEDLLKKVAEMERELATLRARNEELERAHSHTAHHHHHHNHEGDNNLNAPSLHAEHGTTVVSPLVLSPSSIPPGEENILQKQIQSLSKTEDDLIAQLHRKDEKIEFLEQNLTLYKKKLRQTEELLYELQWDPSQDLEIFHIDKKELQSRQEQKISQLLEQMRIMEKGLREKQQMIDDLRGIPASYDEELVEGEDVRNSSVSPSLKSVVVTSDGVPRMNLSGSQTLRNSQNLRRRNSTSHSPHHPSSPTGSSSASSWLSYIPFFGNQSPPAKTATL